MKLLLTSNSDFFYEHIGEYVDKPLDQVKVAWITTARKYSRTPGGVDDHRIRLEGQPFSFVEIDLDGKDEEELRNLMSGCDVVFVIGGSTFELLRAIKESGFEIVLNELLERGVLYSGGSAGAYVVCPTIEMATWKHQSVYRPLPNQDLRALGLVSFLMSVHFNEKYQDDVREGMSKTDLETYILTDDQALYIENDKVTLVGDKQRVILD